MNPKITITPEEARLLRREVRGLGNLARLGFIQITDAGRNWFAQDEERVSRERAAAGSIGGSNMSQKDRARITRAGGLARAKKLREQKE